MAADSGAAAPVLTACRGVSSSVHRVLRPLSNTAHDGAALRALYDDLGPHETAGLFLDRGLPVGDAVATLDAWARGEGLPDGWVPHTTLFLFERHADGSGGSGGPADGGGSAGEAEETIVGVVNVRRRLTPFLREEGGHIGYTVAPSHRQRGVGTAMLALTLQALRRGNVEVELDPAMSGLATRKDDLGAADGEAARAVGQPAVGEPCVLITADSDKVASHRVIERNGGRQIGERFVERLGKHVRHFAVPLSGAHQAAGSDRPT